MPLPASASGLTSLGTIQYNGYVFGPTAQVVKLESKPEYDEAERAVIYLRHTITVKDRLAVSPGTTLDDTIAAARRELMEPGGNLVYRDRGFGNFEINSGLQKDVAYGPRPRDFQYRILGRGIAAEITWTVEACVPFCLDDTATRYEFAIMALNYTVDYSIDQIGYSTRSITGYVEIPATRRIVSDRTLPDHVDAYYERVVPTIPIGFRRVTRNRVISQDKRRMDFTYVDEEMPPQAYPAGITEVDVTHSTQTVKGLTQWVNTIKGTYTVDRNLPKIYALGAFLQMVFARIAETRQVKEATVIPVAFSADDFIYGREAASFSFSYMMTMGDIAIGNLATDASGLITLGLGATAMWRPVAGSSWQQWISSLSGALGAFTPRGYAGLRSFASEDVILNLCDPNPRPIGDSTTLQNLPPGELQPLLNAFPAPTPKASWLRYEPKVEIFVKANTAVLKPLPLANLTGNVLTTTPNVGQVAAETQPFRMAQMSGQPYNSVPDVVQQRATPGLRARLSGYALRAGYEIKPPVIDAIGGVPAVPDGGWFEQCTLFNFGIPVRYGAWIADYIIPNDSGGYVSVPANPETLTDGS